MAPRKDATGPAPSASQTQQDASSEGIEDFELPRLLVTQLAKSTLPKDTKLDDDTLTALVKGSTVFINYLTAAAQDIAASRAHKTISGADVLKALETLEFGELVNAFQAELEVFRQGAKTDKGRGKSLTDMKGKGREKDSPDMSIMVQSVGVSATTDTVPIEDVLGPKDAQNGIYVVDEEMRDVVEKGPANNEVKVTLPIE